MLTSPFLGSHPSNSLHFCSSFSKSLCMRCLSCLVCGLQSTSWCPHMTKIVERTFIWFSLCALGHKVQHVLFRKPEARLYTGCMLQMSVNWWVIGLQDTFSCRNNILQHSWSDFNVHTNHPRTCYNADSDSGGLGWGLWFCICKSNACVNGPRVAIWVMGFYTAIYHVGCCL